MATVALLHTAHFSELYLWTVGIGAVYEVGNYFFPVWYWTFAHSLVVEEIVLILVAYAGLAMMVAAAVHTLNIFSFTWLRFST